MLKVTRVLSIAALTFVAVLALLQQSRAIIRRHELPDWLYMQAAPQYTQCGWIPGRGVVTMLTPRWCVTAAHVIAEAGSRAKVRIGDTTYAIIRRVVHPQWIPKGPHDIALLYLDREAVGLSPAQLFRGSDETHTKVTFLGCGGTGTGDLGIWDQEGPWRAATNVVDSVDEDWLYFSFSDSADPHTTLREGISGPGDSGGPAFIERGDTVFIAGVSVWGTPGASGKNGTYGAIEGYTRISTHLAWIEKTIATTPLSSSSKPQPPSKRYNCASDGL